MSSDYAKATSDREVALEPSLLQQILEKLSIIEKKLEAPQEQPKGFIFGALAKAQGCYKKLSANQRSAGQDYANLEAILDAVKEALSSNGLALYQTIELLDEGTGAAILKTILGHESGQYLESSARVFVGKTDKQTGNTYEIHKRLHALMLLGIAPSLNDPIAHDDNGDEQSDQALVTSIKRPKRKVQESQAVINKEQYKMILKELDGYEEISQDLLETYHLETIADLPAEDYDFVINKIRIIKKNTEEYNARH